MNESRARSVGLAIAIALALVTTAPLALEQSSTTLRTEWGDPDLSGTWVIDNDSAAPFQRPVDNDDASAIAELVESGVFEPARGEDARAYRARALIEWRRTHRTPSSLVIDPPDGRLPPLTPDAERRIATMWKTTWNSDGPWDTVAEFGPDERCISRGLLGSMFPSIDHGAMTIVQTPGLVAIRTDAIHETRMVFVDGRPHLGPGIRGYMGDSRALWDGAALVIETTNFNGRIGARASGNELPTSERLTVMERFTREDGRIRYEATVDDPGTWLRSWTVAFPLTERSDYEIAEYACHENNAPFIRTALQSSRSDQTPR